MEGQGVMGENAKLGPCLGTDAIQMLDGMSDKLLSYLNSSSTRHLLSWSLLVGSCGGLVHRHTPKVRGTKIGCISKQRGMQT